MQKNYELHQWAPCDAENSLHVAVENSRNIFMSVKCWEKCQVWITLWTTGEVGVDGEDYFLGTVERYEEFEFWAPCRFQIDTWRIAVGEPPVGDFLANRCEVWMGYGEDWSSDPVEEEEEESFARVVERAPRNPQFDQMFGLAMRNVEDRVAKLAADMEDRERRNSAAREVRHQAELAATRAIGASSQGSAASGGPSGVVGPLDA